MLFKYKGYDSTGLKVKAKLEASNIEEAKAKLKAKSIFYKAMKIQALKRLLIKSYHLKLFNN
mgnify:CR=1 FL=1